MTDQKLSLGQKVIYVSGKKGKDKVRYIGAISGTDGTYLIKFGDSSVTPWVTEDKITPVKEEEAA